MLRLAAVIGHLIPSPPLLGSDDLTPQPRPLSTQLPPTSLISPRYRHVYPSIDHCLLDGFRLAT